MLLPIHQLRCSWCESSGFGESAPALQRVVRGHPPLDAGAAPLSLGLWGRSDIFREADPCPPNTPPPRPEQPPDYALVRFS
jgi:hypothetical protein